MFDQTSVSDTPKKKVIDCFRKRDIFLCVFRAEKQFEVDTENVWFSVCVGLVCVRRSEIICSSSECLSLLARTTSGSVMMRVPSGKSLTLWELTVFLLRGKLINKSLFSTETSRMTVITDAQTSDHSVPPRNSAGATSDYRVFESYSVHLH